MKQRVPRKIKKRVKKMVEQRTGKKFVRIIEVTKPRGFTVETI